MIINKQKFLDMPIAENEYGIVNTRAVYGNFYEVGGHLKRKKFLYLGKSLCMRLTNFFLTNLSFLLSQWLAETGLFVNI